MVTQYDKPMKSKFSIDRQIRVDHNIDDFTLSLSLVLSLSLSLSLSHCDLHFKLKKDKLPAAKTRNTKGVKSPTIPILRFFMLKSGYCKIHVYH